MSDLHRWHVRLSGFTFVRNGEDLGYPYIESIRSALPICDEFVIAVGVGEDGTLQRLRTLCDQEAKIQLIETTWNENMSDRGFVYAQQKMIAQYACTGDWVFYIEGDEVLHEQDIDTLRYRLEAVHDDKRIEALIFDYYHFFGSPDWLAISPGWYRRAPRILRNTIRTFAPDGLFWIVMDKNKKGRYPQAVLANVPMYHYGHIRKVEFMAKKTQQVGKYWGHNNKFSAYAIDPSALSPFEGKHPAIVADWLSTHAETLFEPNKIHVLTRKERKHRLMMSLERWFGLELSKKHYSLVKDV